MVDDPISEMTSNAGGRAAAGEALRGLLRFGGLGFGQVSGPHHVG
ncbi:MAG: hypothetical protein QGF09_16875 [Rhodospirillales bacterium]|nr:hypothetical protein [Rhodospirillales bacterium]